MSTFTRKASRECQEQIRRPASRHGRQRPSQIDTLARWVTGIINWVINLSVAARKDTREQSLAVINAKYHRMVLRHVGVLLWLLSTTSILALFWFMWGIYTLDFDKTVSLFKLLSGAIVSAATWTAFTQLSRAHEKARDDLKKELAVKTAQQVPDPVLRSKAVAVVALQLAGVQVPANEIIKLLETVKVENTSNDQEAKIKASPEISDEKSKSLSK